MSDLVTNPYLLENRAPVTDEVTATDLPVEGAIPAELEGRWIRNGPNPLPGTADPNTYHWFTGDAMVHGLRLRGGKAEWYRNRWLRSNDVADAFGEPHVPGPRFGGRESAPNTNVGGFAGQTWALVEAGGTPMRLSYDLDTIAFDAFDNTLPAGFSAHPKYDAPTRSLHAMTYAYPDAADRLQYVVVGPDGRVSKTVDIPIDDMVMVHDMSLTQRYAVVYDLPVTVDFDLAMAERFPFRWNPEREARLGLLPRNGQAEDIIWCPVEPCYVFHPMNAYDDDEGNVVLDVCRYDKMFDTDIQGPFGDSLATLDRWTVNPTSASVSTQRISDRFQEFPRHADAVGGLRYQFGYTAEVNAGLVDGVPTFGNTLKIDLTSGHTQVHDHGAGRGGAEPVFVAREGATAEDDGWLMLSVYDATTGGSELVILDAQDFGGPEIARITLPQRVPDGFHGNWVPDSSVAPNA